MPGLNQLFRDSVNVGLQKWRSGHMNSCESNASSDVETPGEVNFPSKIRSPATTRGMLVILEKKR